MFATIRRHQKWLLITISALTIVSFLYYFNPAQRANRNRSAAGSKGPEIDGKPITQKMLNDAANEVRLIYFLNTRKWPEQDSEHAQQMNFDLDHEAYLRLFRVMKAEEAGVHISDTTVADAARRFLGELPLDRFEKEILVPGHLTAEDFERFIRNETANQQLMSIVGAPGRLVTPAEAESLYRREHQEVSGDIVFFHLSNYLSKVVITNGALTNFYAQRPYRVPDKVRVSYVEFSRSNFLADADKRFAELTNLTAQLRDIYYKAGPDKFKDTNGVVLSETNALTKIKEEQRDHLAMSLAARKANEFANKLYDQQQGQQVVTAEALEKLAATNGLRAQISIPFDREDGPTNLDVSPKFAQTAFSLDLTNNPVAFAPIEGEDGYYIIALKEKIAGRFEPFEEVQNKVAEDFKRYSAFTLAYTDATNFIARATDGLAHQKTFEEVAQQSGLKAESLPPISQSTESVTNLEERLDIRRLKPIMFGLEPGKVSSYMPNPPDGGYVVYVRGKLPMDEVKLHAELPKFTADLRFKKQNEIFQRWFAKQVEQAKLPELTRPKRSTGARS